MIQDSIYLPQGSKFQTAQKTKLQVYAKITHTFSGGYNKYHADFTALTKTKGLQSTVNGFKLNCTLRIYFNNNIEKEKPVALQTIIMLTKFTIVSRSTLTSDLLLYVHNSFPVLLACI